MTDIKVNSEPLTYRIGEPVSYFRDLAIRDTDVGARRRLERHAEEMSVEVPGREQRARTRAELAGLELRVNPNRTPGQGGYAAPPLWLLDHFATAARPGRVLGYFIPKFDLPSGVQSVNVPRLVNGTMTGVARSGEPVDDADFTDAGVSSTVVPIAGQGDIPLQLLEQSPPGAHVDAAIFKDLTADYDRQLEVLLIMGTGTAGQFAGLITLTPASNQITYTDGTPTAAKMWPSTGPMAAKIGDNRFMPPEMWLMRTARWAWLGAGEDGQGMPLAVPSHTPPPPQPYLFDDTHPSPVTSILGWPVYPDDAIPTTLGGAIGAGTQDTIIACRPSDMMLLESAPRMRVDLQSLSGVMMARVQMHGYAAALLGRYPTGISTLSGTGMVVQAGF